MISIPSPLPDPPNFGRDHAAELAAYVAAVAPVLTFVAVLSAARKDRIDHGRGFNSTEFIDVLRSHGWNGVPIEDFIATLRARAFAAVRTVRPDVPQ